ncbi:unnamed protein product [Withania somnifera]
MKTPNSSSAPLRIRGGDENDIVFVTSPMMLSSPRGIGRGEGCSSVTGKEVVVSPVIDRNVVDVPSTSKVGGDENDVVSPVVGRINVGEGSSSGSGTEVGVSPIVDRNVVDVPSTSKIGGGDDVYVATPVLDGNKVNVVVLLQRMIGGEGKDGIVSPVRVSVPIPRPLLFPSSGRWPDHAQLLVQNHMNFKKSGKPVRFMVYRLGEWVELGENLIDGLVSAFLDGNPMIEVEREGFKVVFDFYRMLGVDLVTGTEMLISWMDVNGNCFFPKVFCEENVSLENPKIDLEISFIEKNKEADEEKGKRKRVIEEKEAEKGECSSSNAKEPRVVATDLPPLPPKWPRTRSVSEEETIFQMVKGLLFSFVRTNVTVTAVHQCTRRGPMEKARFEVFQKSVETVSRARGDPNVVEYAWYGTSSENVDSIMRRGFDFPRIVPGSHTRCLGIYLSPVSSPQISEMMADMDENGEKHLILCQVIIGKLEKVELGPQQFFPSCADFDTGVDDLSNPKMYVVWCGNMNTHILPVCIVSYKYGGQMSGRLNVASHADDAWSTLLTKLNRLLPSPKVLELQSLYDSYREGKLGKEILMSQLQSVVGDAMLRCFNLEIRGGSFGV